MNKQRYRIVAVGDKSPKMLPELCHEIAGCNCEIQSISSLRLGHSFIVVVMVDAFSEIDAIRHCLVDVVKNHQLKLCIDPATRETFKFVKSDVFIRVKGINTSGIKQIIFSKLTEGGLDIHGLESEMYRNNGKNIFIINIKGHATGETFNTLSKVAAELQEESLEVAISREWSLLI